MAVVTERDGGKRAAETPAGARKRGGAEEAAFLDLVRTVEMLSRRPGQVLKDADLTSNQYNVLRILRGAGEGLTCGEIGNRMITRDPDITRLLDKLERRGLVERSRQERDRRMVLTRITREGLELLERLDGPIQEAHRKQLGHLGTVGLRKLAETMEACRSRLA